MKNIAINIMTKLMVVIMGLFVSSSVLAQNGNVREETARQVGLNFLRLKDGNPRSDLQLTRVDAVQYPNLYVYNTSENGFIVVASDNRMEPILAYSDEGTFDKDNVAPGANFWFEMYEYAIDSIVRNNVRDVDEKITRKWEDLANGVFSEPERSGNYPLSYGPLIGTYWGQGDPVSWNNNFNKFCPWYQVNGKTYRAVTGCIATTLAQMLYYFNKDIPQRNILYSFRHRENHVLNLNGIDGHINLSEKEDDCYLPPKKLYSIGGWSNYSGMDRFAKMMLDCGLAVEMRYGTGESIAKFNNACVGEASQLSALRQYFGFPHAKGKWRQDFPNESRWMDTIKKYVCHNVPVIYRGASSNGGHNFICDGYNAENKFHFNFGWNGSSNGYYYTYDAHGFSAYQFAIFVKPVPDDEIVENDTINMGDERSYFWCFGLINVYQGQQASIGENYIIYDRPGTYTLRNRCDNEPNSQTLILNVIVLPNNTIEKSAIICKRSKFHEEYTYDYQGKTLTVVFDLSRDQTNFDGTKSFYEYFRDDNGNAVAKCILNLTTSGEVHENGICVEVSICDLTDSDGFNRGIYKWDANNDGTIDVECTASGDYEYVEPSNNGGCETVYYLDLTIEQPNIKGEDYVTTCVNHYQWDKSNIDYTVDDYGTYEFYYCGICNNPYCYDNHLYILHLTYSAKDTIQDVETVCFKDLPFEYHGHSITESGPGLYSYNFEEQSNNPDEDECDKYYLLYLTITEDCCKPDPECIKDKITGGNKSTPSNMEVIYYGLKHYYEYRDATNDFLFNVFNGISWPSMEERNVFWNLLQSLLDANTGMMSEEAMLQLIAANPYTYVSENYITNLVERYNRSVMYWNEGHYTFWDLPEGYNPNFIEYDTASMNKAYEAYDYAIAHGFNDVKAMYDNAYELLAAEVDNIQSAVCAKVTVQFNQKMTMTREAFNGTLQIFNGHESIPMQDIMVDFRIKDLQGNDCTNLFQINTLSLDQITGISGDGSLAAQTNGTALVQFIPTKNAAPTEPKVYSFGGSFSFIDPFTGEGLTYPLYPVDITVNPSPDLYVDYFMQRDILGDDALTTDVVEPSVPAELGVIIHNQGAGEAKNVTLETAEPQIIDNEHGLAIDFAMYGASFNGSPRQLGLMEIPFGNIGSGQTAVGEWLFTSSLLGHFVSYEAHVIHNSSYGNSDLSLVSHLDIHELIHPIYAYGNLDDGINDFLVNDNPDAYDTPDSIYFSHGGRTAVGIVDNISFGHYVEPQDTIVILTINPSRIGWNYGVTEDPGRDNYDLVSCTRNYDGQVIPLNNVWQTFVTIPDGGDPVYENKLHIVDTLSNDVQDFTYTLVYSLKNNQLDVLEITGIPESYIDYPLESFTVRFNEAIIDSTFTFEDMTLKCQNGPNLMDSTVVITKVNDSIYDVSISGLTNETGLYVLNVSTLNIKDVRGHYGYNGKQASWVQVITNHTQTCTLASGWNWWSTYIDTSTEQVFDMLKSELGSNASMIKSRNDGFVTYMGDWYGTLQTINNQSMYMINMNSEQTISITGSLASLASNPITINNGWNWIGFPSNVSVDINSALNNLTPAESDLIKTRNAFATYYSSMGGWFGTLTSLTPGLGYMYQSNNEETFEFVYSTISRNDIEPFEVQMTNHWEIFVGEYSDNATLIGVIAINGEEQRDENLIVGAFIGDRCVGEVNAIYVEPFDRYMVFLTYFGNENDRITFRLHDENTGIETIGSETSLVFNANSMIGLIEEPLVISFVSTTSVEEFTMNARLFPNPVKAMEKVNVGLKNVDAASMKIEIVNTLGMVVYQKTYHTVAIDITAPRLPGIYIVKITEDNGNVYYGKLIVE